MLEQAETALDLDKLMAEAIDGMTYLPIDSTGI